MGPYYQIKKIMLKRGHSDLPKASESLVLIERILMSMDVITFTKEFDDNNDISALYFTIEKKEIPVRIPLNLDGIIKTLNEDIKLIKKKGKYEIREMAEDIMFSELAKFIEMISSMVKNKQTTLHQAFLSFTYDLKSDKTFYELMEAGDIKKIE